MILLKEVERGSRIIVAQNFRDFQIPHVFKTRNNVPEREYYQLSETTLRFVICALSQIRKETKITLGGYAAAAQRLRVSLAFELMMGKNSFHQVKEQVRQTGHHNLPSPF